MTSKKSFIIQDLTAESDAPGDKERLSDEIEMLTDWVIISKSA